MLDAGQLANEKDKFSLMIVTIAVNQSTPSSSMQVGNLKGYLFSLSKLQYYAPFQFLYEVQTGETAQQVMEIVLEIYSRVNISPINQTGYTVTPYHGRLDRSTHQNADEIGTISFIPTWKTWPSGPEYLL